MFSDYIDIHYTVTTQKIYIPYRIQLLHTYMYFYQILFFNWGRGGAGLTTVKN